MAKTHTLRLRVTKAAAGTLAAATLFGALGMSAESAAAAPSESTVTTTPTSEGFGGLTASQWQEIAAAAERAGDHESAQAARKVAEESASGQLKTGTQSDPEVLKTIVKKLIKIALKQGRPFLPKPVRDWADKIYDLIDFLDTSTELTIATFLMHNGIPADVALDIARWIALFA